MRTGAAVVVAALLAHALQLPERSRLVRSAVAAYKPEELPVN